jgi:hypothetical protein
MRCQIERSKAAQFFEGENYESYENEEVKGTSST